MSVETIIKLENVVKVFDDLEVIHHCNMNVPKVRYMDLLAQTEPEKQQY